MELASLAQLERSHRRHDDVMAELLDAARRFAAGRPDDGDLARVQGAVAYFSRAVTRHFLDEEGSVFPRLSTRRPELAAALAALSAEHPVQIALQAEVAAAARDLDGDARPNAGKTLLDAAVRLADAHRAHVVREDGIFATAHEALTAEDDAEIVAEMETRRGRDDDGGGRGRGGGGGGRGGRGRGGGRGGGGGGSGGGGRGRSRAESRTSARAAKQAAAEPAARSAAKSASRGTQRAGKATAARAASRAKPAKRAAARPTRRAAPKRRGKR